jgi:arylformamidase
VPDATGNGSARRLWDISPPVHARLAGVPGRHALPAAVVATIGPGCPVNVSALTLSPHVGAHADAPLHYDPTARHRRAGPDALPGPCRVIHAIGCGPLVQWQHLPTRWPACRRACWCAPMRMPVDRWDGALTAYAPDTVERLADLGVQLVGIDTASIDPADSKTLDSHQVIRRAACACWRTWCSTTCPRATTNSSPCP